MNFVVLSSSRGTTHQAVLDALQDESLTATFKGLIADRDDRGCVSKTKDSGYPVSIIERMKDEERKDYDKRVDAAIRDMGEIDVIACIGWMYLFSEWFVNAWQGRIVNVHPSLLPRHPGAHAITDTLKAGDTESGMTIHIIDKGLDTGPKLVQKSCSVLPDDTEDSLKERVQNLEKEWYPKVLQMMQTGELTLPSL